MVRRHCRSKRWQIMCPHLRGGFKAGGQLYKLGLTECGAEKADAKWCAKNHSCRNLDNWITGSRRESRGTEDEVISKNKVGSPSGIIGRRNHGIKLKLLDCCIYAFHTCFVVEGEGLVVRHAMRKC